MKCKTCEHFIDGTCKVAENGKFSDIDDVSCLLRLLLVTLQNVYEFLPDERNEKPDDPADFWKL